MGDSPKLRERDVVLSAIDKLLESTLQGHGGSLFVIGEAGLGKSSLLEAAIRRASSRFKVGLGRGDPMETSLPFGFLSQALEGLRASDLVISGAQPPFGVRASRSYRLQRWLETVPDPILFAFDDLQWADRDSIELITFLVRRSTGLKVAFVGTLRPWPRDIQPVVYGLAHSGYASIERLAPLGLSSARELLAAHLGRSCEEPVARSIWRLCAGNPLLLEQAALTLSIGDRIPDLSPASHPETSRDLLLARFAILSPEAIRLVRAASVCGVRFRLDVAAELSQLSDSEVLEAADALCRSGLIIGAADGALEFVHPLFRQALYDDSGPAAVLQLHRSALRALVSRGLEGEAAEHAIRAGAVGDSEAISLLERTGRIALEDGAVEGAVRHLSAAVRLAGDHPPARLLIARGEALLACGRADEALKSCERLRGELEESAPQRVHLLRLLGRMSFAVGEVERAGSLFSEAAAVALGYGATNEAIDILLDHAVAGWLVNGPRECLPIAVEARKLATDAQPALHRRVDAVWGFLSLLSGDPSGWEATAGAARDALADGPPNLGDLTFGWGPLTLYSLSAMQADRFDEALRFQTIVLEAAEQLGALEGVAWHCILRGYTLSRMGRLADALTSTLRAHDLAEHLVAPAVDEHIAIGATSILLQLGRVSESDEWAARADHYAGQGGNLSQMFVWDARGQRLLRHGYAAQSADYYTKIVRRLDAAGVADRSYGHWARHAIAAYLACDRISDARDVVGSLQECASHVVSRWSGIAVATGRAWLAEREGDRLSAEAAFETALVLHQHIDMPLEKVETLLAWGGYLRRSGQTASARRVLGEAWRLAESLGAGWLAAQAGEELGVAGGRRRKGRDPLELTPQEDRVRQLATSGLSNREIAAQLSVSENTVETHLQHVYSKLGVRSRRELMIAEDVDSRGSP